MSADWNSISIGGCPLLGKAPSAPNSGNTRATVGNYCRHCRPCSLASPTNPGSGSEHSCTQSHETVKYGHESCGTRNQEWLCWRRPRAIYPTDWEWLWFWWFWCDRVASVQEEESRAPANVQLLMVANQRGRPEPTWQCTVHLLSNKLRETTETNVSMKRSEISQVIWEILCHSGARIAQSV
jgi:hypothetical protein